MELVTGHSTFLALARRLDRWVRTSLNALIDDLAGWSTRSHDWQAMIFVGTEIEVYRRGKTAPERLAVPGREFDDQTLAGLQRCLAKTAHKKISLRFSTDKAVTRLIALPAAAQDVIPAIVRNKVESLAPWPLSEALWGFRRSDDRAQAGHLNIEVGIVGRRAVEALLLSLKKMGAEVSRLDIADGPETDAAIEIDFLRANETERIRKRLRSGMTWLGLAAAACGGFGLYIAVSSMAELNEMETRTNELTNALHEQSADSSEGGKLSEARKLVERKRTEQPAMQVVEALTRLIPNDAWLEALDYEDHQVTIVGRGTSIPPIVEALEKSNVFKDVNFASPTQHDAVANVDSFSISASVPPVSVAQ
jgi:general secretion pathway protein L